MAMAMGLVREPAAGAVPQEPEQGAEPAPVALAMGLAAALEAQSCLTRAPDPVQTRQAMTKQLPHRLRSLLGSLTGSQRDPRSSAVSRRGTVLALALGVMLVSPGCKGDRTKADSWQDNAGEPASSSSEPSTSDTSSSSSVGSLGMMSSLLSGQVSQPGPYEEPDASEGFDSDAPHTAVVELSGAVTELKGFSWTGGFEGTEMRPLLDRLHELAAEENVSGLLLRFGDLSIGQDIAE